MSIKIPHIPKADNPNDWTCTDPDNHQYGRKISDGVYQFKEWIGGGKLDEPVEKTIKECFDKPENWEENTITLSDYTEEEIRNHISAYYDSLEALREIYENDSDWIIAECIFEQESALY
jgi:hypothetical protein